MQAFGGGYKLINSQRNCCLGHTLVLDCLLFSLLLFACRLIEFPLSNSVPYIRWGQGYILSKWMSRGYWCVPERICTVCSEAELLSFLVSSRCLSLSWSTTVNHLSYQQQIFVTTVITSWIRREELSRDSQKPESLQPILNVSQRKSYNHGKLLHLMSF